MSNKILKVHPKDNVIVALQDLAKGETVTYEGESYTLVDDVPAKHKFFTHDMAEQEKIIMYGVLVGKAQYAIAKGARMTTDNVKHAADPFAYRPYHYEWHAPDVSKFADKTFN